MRSKRQVSQERLAVARGEVPADLALKGGRVVNLFDGRIEEVDVAGLYLCPGFIDGHLHVESTLLGPAELARAVAPRGTPRPWWTTPTRSPTCWGWRASRPCWPARRTCP